MLFSKVDTIRDETTIHEKAEELGLEYRSNSYDIKFDLKENFMSDCYYTAPAQQLSVGSVKALGETIKNLLNFHYLNSNSEAYYCVAENHKLKCFYDRLADKYQKELNFNVAKNLGEEGLGYEITTPSYKS